ncbi:ankyrin domain protein [Campylobacter ureolyticus RIGS 9880]|uniref:Ankyrin domain protein n=1 Tax=Campylobacter ureolyticus RIGS 9880 TaxID=1032069 RepID=A0AAU8TZ13_9BACT|nr:ankyrin repeat domain-containing protein [Campylobacter ureolyticus]AKT90522.1 ankyrin domain protein [Campylobacter ureolyticus RIGS 9880]
MKNKFLNSFIIITLVLVAFIVYNKFKLSQNSHFTVTADTVIKPGSEISKYVTQEEVDSFAFRYWDIDNNYTKFVNPITVPLRDALKQKDTNKVLLYSKDNNLSVDIEIEDGTTPLMYSSFYNDLNTTKELINLGADIHKKDKYGLSPMAYAIENNSTEIVKILFNNGVKFEEVEVIQGYLEPPNYGSIKSLIIDNDSITIEYESYWEVFDGPKTGQSPFSYVANRNFIEIAKFMLENGYKPKTYFTFGYDSKQSNNFEDIFSPEEEKQHKEWTSGFSRYDYTNYKALEYIPNFEPMLDLLLEHNISGQPSKELMKREYDRCYDFYYDPCFDDFKNKCKPVFDIFPEIYGLKNSYEMFKKYCPDKNGTFKNTKDFISYRNSEKKSYAISFMFSGDSQNKVYMKDRNATLRDIMIDKYNNSANKNEKDFIKTYYLKE